MAGARQHTTPAFHLAQFITTNPKGCVWVYDAESQDVRPSSPESAGFARHFYSVRQPDGIWDNRLDDWITDVESKAEPIYRRMLASELPKDDTQEKADFAVYLALMWARTPARRRVAAETYVSLAAVATDRSCRACAL